MISTIFVCGTARNRTSAFGFSVRRTDNRLFYSSICGRGRARTFSPRKEWIYSPCGYQLPVTLPLKLLSQRTNSNTSKPLDILRIYEVTPAAIREETDRQLQNSTNKISHVSFNEKFARENGTLIWSKK